MRRLIFAGLLGLACFALATSADAHARLDRAEPAVGSTVQSPPKEIVLTFTENLESAFSSIQVVNARGESMNAGKASASGNRMRVPVKALAPGRYTVKWRVLSVDTHRTDGTFSFEVSP